MCSHFSKKNWIRFIFIISFCFISVADTFGTTYYEIWRNTTNNSSSATRIKEWYTSTSYDDPQPSPGQHNYYWVKVVTANTAYDDHSNMTTEVTGKLWVTCPTSAVQGQYSRILYKARLEPFGFYNEGNLTNYLREDDSFSDDTMTQWNYPQVISISGTTAWEYEWTKDVIISNYEPLNSTAEVYGTFDFLHGNHSPYTYHVTPQTNVISCAVVSSYSSPPSGANASQGTYPDKIRIQWNPASGVSSFSSSCEGWRSVDYALTVQSSGASNVSISSSTGHGGATAYNLSLASGTSVSLTAPPTSGSMVFTGWTGAVTSSNQTISLTMTGNKTVTANYAAPSYTLTVNSSGAGGVSISSSTGHGGITNYTKTVTSGTSVTLTAPRLVLTPIGEVVFTGWTGSVSSSNQSITFTMDGNKTVTANYPAPSCTLTVNSSVASGVSITSSTGHGGTTNYTKTVTWGTSVSLTAPASSGGMTFTGWTGDVTSGSPTISFSTDGNKTVTANYMAPTYTLTVNSSGTSGVSVTSSTGHGGITNYTKSVNDGSSISLTAPATASGKTFIGWTGDVSSGSQTISFSMNGHKTVTLNYATTTYQLTTSVSGGNGTLSPSSRPYGEGIVVILTATADDGYRVKAWSGTDNDLSKANTNTVTMNNNKSVTVEFEIGQENPSGWNVDLYDLHNSNLYPYPSGTNTGNAPFIEQWSVPGIAMKTGDVDGDGALELVTSDGSNLYVYGNDGQLKWQMATTSSLNALADVTGDGKLEILMNMKNGAVARIDAYDISRPNSLVKTFTTSVDLNYGNVSARGVVDLDQNGSLELIATKGAAWVQGRGVVVFNCETANELWYYDVGPFVQYPAVGDVAGLLTDAEILHGSGGPSNGVTGADGSTDSECYAFLVDASGNSLWRKQFEGYGFADASTGLCDIDNNDRLDIIATSYSHGWDLWGGSTGRVYILDPISGEPISGLEHNFAMPVTLGGFADLDEDDIPEILVNKIDGAIQTGSILALSPISGLPVKYEFFIPGSTLTVLFINDLNGDGKLEVIVKSTPAEGADNTLYVLDNELNLLWSMNMPEGFTQAIVSDIDEDSMNEIIIAVAGNVVVLEGNEYFDVVGDFDGDGDVDMIDFGIMANEWLLTNDPMNPMADPDLILETDLNGDCYVDFLDLAIFVSNWLEGISTVEKRDAVLVPKWSSSISVEIDGSTGRICLPPIFVPSSYKLTGLAAENDTAYLLMTQETGFYPNITTRQQLLTLNLKTNDVINAIDLALASNEPGLFDIMVLNGNVYGSWADSQKNIVKIRKIETNGTLTDVLSQGRPGGVSPFQPLLAGNAETNSVVLALISSYEIPLPSYSYCVIDPTNWTISYQVAESSSAPFNIIMRNDGLYLVEDKQPYHFYSSQSILSIPDFSTVENLYSPNTLGLTSSYNTSRKKFTSDEFKFTYDSSFPAVATLENSNYSGTDIKSNRLFRQGQIGWHADSNISNFAMPEETSIDNVGLNNFSWLQSAGTPVQITTTLEPPGNLSLCKLMHNEFELNIDTAQRGIYNLTAQIDLQGRYTIGNTQSNHSIHVNNSLVYSFAVDPVNGNLVGNGAFDLSTYGWNNANLVVSDSDVSLRPHVLWMTPVDFKPEDVNQVIELPLSENMTLSLDYRLDTFPGDTCNLVITLAGKPIAIINDIQPSSDYTHFQTSIIDPDFQNLSNAVLRFQLSSTGSSWFYVDDVNLAVLVNE